MKAGHKNKLIDKKNIAEYLRPVIHQEAIIYGITEPTEEQIALVISALKDQTLLIYASEYDMADIDRGFALSDFHPVQVSVARFFRDSARLVLDKEE